MQRSWLQRTVAIVLVAWFAALTAAPVTLHPCPMHDGVLALTSTRMMGHQMDMGGMAHTSAMPHADPSQMPAHHPGSQHQCTCLGSCTAAGVMGLPSPHLTLASALLTRPHDPGLPDYRYVPVAAQHVLPFAHAPPQA
ncbi:MAG TPA: hypothetical protein VF166_03210 [Gemmatimonadaceae bacterium]